MIKRFKRKVGTINNKLGRMIKDKTGEKITTKVVINKDFTYDIKSNISHDAFQGEKYNNIIGNLERIIEDMKK